MTLAWRNLTHDLPRFAVTLAGIAFAVFLMIFQGSLLVGFVRAASSVIDATDADLWIAARGVPCLDFATPLPDAFQAAARGVPGVRTVRRLAAGFSTWQKPSGARQTVIVVGAEAGVGSGFPLPREAAGVSVPAREAVFVDRSNREALDIRAVPASTEIGGRRAHVAAMVDGFASFVGSPYVFTHYRDAHRYLALRAEETVFLLVHLEAGRDPRAVQAKLGARLPEADVWTRPEFARRARAYWLTQTGAGGTILTAAVLGFLVGLVVVSQNIYATTLENIEEFATLKAMGATRRYVQRVVVAQALLSGLIGSLLGIAATVPLVAVIAGAIPWIVTPAALPVGVIGASLAMCGLASMASVRKAVAVDPAKVFRA
jgi:putative ABC transport system permease protein